MLITAAMVPGSAVSAHGGAERAPSMEESSCLASHMVVLPQP